MRALCCLLRKGQETCPSSVRISIDSEHSGRHEQWLNIKCSFLYSFQLPLCTTPRPLPCSLAFHSPWGLPLLSACPSPPLLTLMSSHPSTLWSSCHISSFCSLLPVAFHGSYPERLGLLLFFDLFVFYYPALIFLSNKQQRVWEMSVSIREYSPCGSSRQLLYGSPVTGDLAFYCPCSPAALSSDSGETSSLLLLSHHPASFPFCSM